MAADAEILRQFLVSIGFQVNEVQKRTFDTSINKVDKTVKALGATMIATATSAQALVAGFANSFERLYYLRQRTGTTVADLKAAGDAGKRIGLNAGQVEQVVKNIDFAIRSRPGTAELIQSLTGKTTAGSKTKVLENIIGSLKTKPDFYALQVADRLGIDADTYLQLKDNLSEYLAAEEQQRRIYKEMGVDLDDSADKLKAYSNTLKELEIRAEAVGAKIAVKMLPAFSALAIEVGNAFDNLSKFIDLFDKPKPFGQITKTESSTRAPNWFDNVLPTSWVSWLTTGNANAQIAALPPGSSAAGGGRGRLAPPRVSPSGTSLPGTRGARNNNPGNIEYGDFARSMGATGSDGRFAIFPDLQTGTQAMAALLASYGQRGYNTVGSIINRWAPPKENNTSKYGSFLAGRLGVGLDTPLDLSPGSRDISRLVSGIGLYDSGFDPLQSGASIVQNNNITVNGVDDPNTAGRIIMENQQKVNASLTANRKGAIR